MLGLLLASVDAVQSQVVSPASEESQAFRRKIIELSSLVMDDVPAAERLREARIWYLRAAEEHGSQQRERLARFQQDLNGALLNFRGVVDDSFSDQGQLVREFGRSASGLRAVEQCDDMERIKHVVRTELHHIAEVVRAHVLQHDALKKRYASAIREFERSVADVRRSGDCDATTGCANRAAMDFQLLTVCRKCEWEGLPFAVAMLDLDDFKEINDHYGHQVGDAALAHFATAVKAGLPEGAFLARYGGDEFMVIAHGTARDLAKALNSALAVIHQTPFAIEGSKKALELALQGSGGVTDVRPTDTPAAVISRADQALYAAKRTGKAHVEVDGNAPKAA